MAYATANMHYDRLTLSSADSIGNDSPSRHRDLSPGHPAVSLAALMSENAALRSELSAVELQRAKLAETQRRIIELLGVESADRLVHDVRNLLNERALLKALVDMSD